MTIVISQPTTAPFVQQAARALYEADLLDAFVTTIAVGEEYDSGPLSRRQVREVPIHQVDKIPFGEICRLIVGRFDRQGILTDKVWEWAEQRFDRKVAAMLQRHHQAVYCYEHAALASFERAKELGLKCIYDVPAPEHEFTHALMKTELEAYPELVKPYHRHIAGLQEKRTRRRHKEFQRADLVLANSQFTRNSYIESGLGAEKVAVVPYGAPAPHPSALEGGGKGSQLKALWVGSFSIRKGAHYLLEAWDEIADGAELAVFGSQQLPSKFTSNILDTIKLSGTIPHNQLAKEYLQSDVLVFPTLCDGFGMVVTEALAHGVPVITTPNAGAADLIEDGVNGFLVEAGNVDELKSVLSRCANDLGALRAMRSAALESAKSWQWSDYRSLLIGEVNKVLENG